MVEFCHRCQAELPERLPRAEILLFCPHCSAPQLMLPETMRVEGDSSRAKALSPAVAPGAGVEWRAVLPTAAWVAVVGGLMSVLGLKSGFIGAISPLWVLASGSIVLGVYLRRRPGARMDGLSGWRIGLVTGLLLVGAKGVGLSATGLVARFATHSMAEYDADWLRNVQAQQVFTENLLPTTKADSAFAERYREQREWPELKAGYGLGVAGFNSAFILLFAGLGGLFSGAVERRRRLVAGRS